MTSRIVIIGGGQAGGWAAKTLRDEGFEGEICVVAEEAWDFYERPPLSKASLLEPDAALPRLFSEEAQQALDLTWYRPLRAEQIDRQTKTVCLSNGTHLSYNILLIATGGRARLPGEAWAAHPQVYTLRHWQDAQRLKGRLAQSKTLAIVGGGWIGLEIAASARKNGVAVTLFEQQPALCMRSVSGEVSQRLAAIHREQGVDIRTGCGALELEDDNGLPVIHCDGQRETFNAVVVGIGVDLNLELAHDAGLHTGRGIVVDAHGRTSDPFIFAAGDVAQHHHYGLCIQSWAFAQNQAVATAKAMLNPDAPGYDDAPWLWSDQYQHNIQILGIPHPGSNTIAREDSLFFSLDENGRLTQLVAFNDARTVKLAKRWMAAGRDLSDVPLADPTFSLMSLR
ncbi:MULTISPECIES: NAD(P)/FAD-dependent oxidoreductase [Enterobacter]|uniref:FAD-dependent oxidoreductase n=1 Tax=Enterobacter kobei TaxID=208224 RepID=A0AAJ6ISZ8_9ENTR|nr:MULTISPECIES: FAD-dependent oxidoreductase [Enterobacter]AMZ76058.1 pyridine nucleotide-disulfide oxidoreductase [Enterobacter sp. ODB01]AOP88339.1 pyridine nucleotide-disulfide oxidoreductase [Enterobacter kobei]EHF8262259.1 FAD-dependent oxidoreductase [Enterobacter kobei]EKM5742663.1 FAD-dependent oxidoreductase [Enterobacter kobei]ELK6697929.1 FAD-dependent oxidoreductase [Enterobacter kobei]